MANLSLKHIYKVYDGGVKAVNDFSMEIKDKEFIVFVGPSGCGKSTTLRMIAGLEEITAGELRIDDVIVNDMEPKDRNIAMVFQNYALYPHMTVYENMAFSLKILKIDDLKRNKDGSLVLDKDGNPVHVMRHLTKEEIHTKIIEAAKILDITEYLDRKPKALSGGQRQRVALGRAIVRNPKVFLLDEPLSNLDAKLRAAMRAEITRLHDRLQTTFIYVTHDQVEAMTMGTRIVVMKLGYVQQIDTPQNLYKYPGNMFVAGFIGTPQMNFFDATILKDGNNVDFNLNCGITISMDYSLANKILVKYMDGKYPVVVGVRPDDVRLADELLGDGWSRAKAVVSVVEHLGGETLIYANLNLEDANAKESAIVIKHEGDCNVYRGDVIDIAIRKENIHVFDKESELSIKKRLPQENVFNCTICNNKVAFAGYEVELPSALHQQNTEQATINIPTDAVLLGKGNLTATVAKTEQIGDKALYQLTCNDTIVFAVEDGEIRFKEGDTVNFELQFKKVSIEAEQHYQALETLNAMDGNFVKIKEVQENGKKGFSFYIQIGDQRIVPSRTVCEKLFACKGTSIFKTPLVYEFDAEGVSVVEEKTGECLVGSVSDILDYGQEKFAMVDVQGVNVCAPITGLDVNVGDSVNLLIDQSALIVKDKTLDIIIL